MAKFSTGLRNGMLDDSGARAQLANGKVLIYSGAAPDTADAAPTGMLLATYTVDGGGGIHFDAPVDGVLPKAAAEVWKTLSAANTGNAGYFRIVGPSDGGAASTADPRVQGTVGTVAADLLLSSVAFVAGQPYTLKYVSIALPTL